MSTSVTPAPTAPKKNPTMTMVNRILLVLVILVGVAAAVMITLSVMRSVATENTRKETESTRQQAADLYATNWCNQITADNASSISSRYADYSSADQMKSAAIDSRCPKRVEVAQVVSTFSASDDFKISDKSCTMNADGKSVSCAAEVTVTDSDLVAKLPDFSSVDVTLKMTYSDSGLSFMPPKHTENNVAIVKVDSDGKGTSVFQAPYDSSWGDYYSFAVTSFFPNE